MKKTVSKIGEFGLIDFIRKSFPSTNGVIKGIGDDTAVIAMGTKKVLFTTDMLMEGVHFTRAMKPKAIGHKALACNISDIAAMGGVPTYALISLGIPKGLDIDFVKKLYSGIKALAKKFQVHIIGGDTIESKKIIVNVSLLGEAKRNKLMLRSGAKCGDIIFVTGPLGRSLKNGKHLSFIPRVKEAQFLCAKFKPTAMIDISDGLAADLSHILTESKVGACLYEEQIPLAAKANLNDALYDGEDFELLFTLLPQEAKRLQRLKKSVHQYYPIGEIVSKRDRLQLVNRQGHKIKIKQKGYTHF